MEVFEEKERVLREREMFGKCLSEVIKQWRERKGLRV